MGFGSIWHWIVLLVILGCISYCAYHKGQEFWAKLQEQWAQANLSFQDFGYGWFITGVIGLTVNQNFGNA